MDGRREKVVCHLPKGGDINKDIKQRVLSGVAYMTKTIEGRELSFGRHHRGKNVERRNRYCI